MSYNSDRQQGAIQLVVLVTILAIPITLLSTTPVVFHLKGFLPGGEAGADATEHMYLMWWFHHALTELNQSPAELTLLAYPTGYYNPYITVTPLVRLIALPFMGWVAPTVFYNVYLLATFVLTWVTMSCLCYDLVDDFEAAIIGGFVFSFAPQHLVHAASGHITAVTTFLFPLLLLSVLRFLRRPRWWLAVLCGVLLSACLAIDLNLVFYFVVPLLVVMVILFVKHHSILKQRRSLLQLGLIILVPVLVLGPLYTRFILDKMQGRLDFLKATGTTEFSIDLTSFFVPPPHHILNRILTPLKKGMNCGKIGHR